MSAPDARSGRVRRVARRGTPRERVRTGRRPRLLLPHAEVRTGGPDDVQHPARAVPRALDHCAVRLRAAPAQPAPVLLGAAATGSGADDQSQLHVVSLQGLLLSDINNKF